MKKLNFQQTFYLSRILLALSLTIMACDKEDDDDMNNNTYSLSGSATGSNEVPPVTTSATALLSGTYNADSNKLNYNITWNGLSGLATGMHFHGPAITGVKADVIHGLTIGTNGSSGSASGSLIIADSTENHLLNGRIYYNIHTVLNPDGEIRAQVLATAH